MSCERTLDGQTAQHVADARGRSGTDGNARGSNRTTRAVEPFWARLKLRQYNNSFEKQLERNAKHFAVFPLSAPNFALFCSLWVFSKFDLAQVRLGPEQTKIFPGDPEELNEVPWSRRGNPKSFALTIPWNLASLVRNYPGIIVPSTPHRSETNEIAERAVRRVKESTIAVLLQSGLGNEWWVDSMECYCYLRNTQDLLSDGKTHVKRRFGMPFNGPVIPFGAMVSNFTIFLRKTNLDCISLEQQSCQVYF